MTQRSPWRRFTRLVRARARHRVLLLFVAVCGACGAGDIQPASEQGDEGGASGRAASSAGRAAGRGGSGAGGQVAAAAGEGGGSSTPGPVGAGGTAGLNASRSDAGVESDASDPGPPPGSVPTFASAGYSGVRLVSRDLGLTWVERQTTGGGGDDPNLIRGIGCGNGLCVVGGGSAGSTGFLKTTKDGHTWSDCRTQRPGISDVAFGKGFWVGVSGNYGLRSDDGYAWDVGSDKGVLGPGGILRRMTFAGGKFIAWGDGGKRAVTEDGRKWTIVTSGSAWEDVAFGAGVFVAVAGGGAQTSTDAITWNAGGPGGHWIVWTGTQFVVGGDGVVRTSPDGKTWTDHKGNPPRERVAYGAGVFVSWGARSLDGIAWKSVPATNDGITDVDFGYLAPP